MIDSDHTKPATVHTPGPWTYNDAAIVQDAQGIIIADCEIVPQCEHCEPTPEQEVANARLIAAAPDLLQALEAASDWIDAQLFAPRLDIQAKVRAALAKAKGGCL